MLLTDRFALAGYFKAFYRMLDVEDAADPAKVAACCPKDMDPELALQVAQGAIHKYLRLLHRRATCDWGGPKKEDAADHLD